MSNPTRALDALCGCGEKVAGLELAELTLGHAIVLEKIGCPLLADKIDVKKLRILDLLPTVYVLAVPVAESMRAIGQGRASFDQAVAEWGAKIPLASGRVVCEAVARIFKRVSEVAPQGGPEGNAPAATAG